MMDAEVKKDMLIYILLLGLAIIIGFGIGILIWGLPQQNCDVSPAEPGYPALGCIIDNCRHYSRFYNTSDFGNASGMDDGGGSGLNPAYYFSGTGFF
jgi:hypothetical protein